jgi:hypothetical protein
MGASVVTCDNVGEVVGFDTGGGSDGFNGSSAEDLNVHQPFGPESF